MGEIASLKAELAKRQAMLPAFMQNALEELTSAMQAQPHAQAEAQAQAQAEAPPEVQAQPKAPKRTLVELGNCLPLYSAVYIQSLGERWECRLAKNAEGELGFYDENEVFYTSPDALSKAHASRITVKHPRATKHGSGWEHIRIADGPKKDMSIGKLIAEYRANH